MPRTRRALDPTLLTQRRHGHHTAIGKLYQLVRYLDTDATAFIPDAHSLSPDHHRDRGRPRPGGCGGGPVGEWAPDAPPTE
jgi:hypothetical protein